MTRLLHRALLFVVTITTFTSLVLVRIAPSASATTPDPGVQQLVDTLDGASNSLQAWTSGLATVGKLAEGLPGVGTSAGSVLGFTDLLHQWFNNGTQKVHDAAQYADLNIDENIDLGSSDGRTGHLTTALTDHPDGKQLHVDISATKTVGNQALTIPLPVGTASSAPQSAFSSQGGVNLTVSAHLVFDLVWNQNDNTVSITANATTPSLNVDATAHLGTLTDIHAGIGILGVSVNGGSTLDLSAHFAATVSDPNNDGKLSFANGGELAQNGSLAGLVNFGFANPAGALNAHLLLSAAASTSPVPIPLPTINATIDVAWPDISTGSPTVTPTGIDVAGRFLNMTPRDLAEGIAQLVTSLTSIERSKVGNVNLPFLKGTLADAIQLNEALKQFLHDNTVQGDPAQAGHPTFVSLQELLDRLNTATGLPGGATIGVSDLHWNDPKFDFKITLHRAAPGTGIDLNSAAAAVSGGPGSTYTATTLTDSSQNWQTNAYAGRHVVAGSSGATIVSNTANTLTLQAPGWSPTVPTPGSAYAISGMEGDVGVVALGDSLQTGGKGVAEANAVNATAKVKPSYDASITLVLNLVDPTVVDPPTQQTNSDGSTYLVSATPTGADRVLLRTNAPLFTADMPIEAGVDVFANAGFLQVRLQGTAKVCKTNPSSDCSDPGSSSQHMIEVSLKDKGDLTFGQVVGLLLNSPGDLLDYNVHVAGAGSVNVSVPDAPTFFPSTASASFHWDDVTTGTPQFDLSGLSQLTNVDFDPSNPKQLFSIILKTLQTLDKAIGDADPSGASIFSQQIPVVGRSLRDLLRSDESGMGSQVSYGTDYVQDLGRSAGNGNAFPQTLVGRSVVAGTQVGIVKTVSDNKLTMASAWATKPGDGTTYLVRSELDDVISILQNSPSDNLQALVKVLNDRLGHTSPVTFAYEDDSKVGNQPSLVINVDWKRSFHTSAPVQFDFSLPIGDQKLAGAQGSGLLSLSAGGEVKIGLVVPLAPGDGPADASALKILDNSHIGVNLDASVDNASIATTIGPLSLALGDPTSSDKAKAKASYSIDLSKSGGTGNAVTFDNFLSAVGPNFNTSSNAVDCGFGGSTPLALCATLPLYVSNDGGTTYTKLIDPGANAFNIRLPKSTTPIGDYFDLTGAQIDGHDRLETPDATALGNAIQSHLIDLTRIDGIDGFINLLVTSLNTASFGGKLPLVGDDLQQGADFLTHLKNTIDASLGSLASVSSTSDLRDWVNNQLATGLQNAGLNPDTVKVDTLCSTTLNSAAAPTVTANPAGGSHTFTYAIVTYITNSSGDQLDAQPSPDGSATDANFTTIDSTHTLSLTWTAVAGAKGYKVYRKDGGQLKLLKDVGTATSYTDNGTDTAGAAPTNAAGPNPHLVDCGITDFDSVIIRLNVSQGDFSGDYLNCTGLPAGHECIDKSVPLDIGIPGLSLRAATPGDGPHVQLGWRLHLAFGISRSEGFFVDTKDGDPQPEFALGLNFTLPSEMNAQLAFINITAKNCDNTMTTDCDTAGAPAPGAVPPLFGGSFKINITSPHSNGHLTLSDLSSADLSSLFDAKLTAGVHIDWLLKAKVGQDAGFPGIQSELRMAWQWTNADPGANSGGGVTPLSISFLKVQIDAGAVFGQILGPVVNQIKQVTGPLDPVIKTLYAPIPVLSDLSHLVGGDDVTLVSIAKAFSTIAGGPDLTFVDTITGVIQFINNMPTCTTSCLIPIGSFNLSGGKAIDNSATPSNTESLIDTGSKTLDPSVGGSSGALGALDSKDSKSTGSLNGGANSQSKKAGFSFPVFEKPSSLFNLLLGGDVDLVKFDSGPLTLGFDWRQEFGPVYAPPPVLVTLHGSADVTLHIVAGFDTYGIRKAFEAARAGQLDLGTVGEAFLQSLFFYTTDDAGKPIPVVQFHGELAAGAEVSAVIIKVGIEGGVSLTVSFLWNDPNHDGKFRISEFLAVALNNPICLFSVSGRVGVFLRAYITIGFSPFSVSFSFTIVDVTLLDFSVTPDCSPPPPQLGGVSGDGKTLVVFAGALGHSAQRGDAAYESNNEDKDSVKIQSLHDYSVTPPTFKGIGISMLGIHREFLNPNIERVLVLGGGPGVTDYTKPMSVTFIGDGKEDTAKTGPKPPTASFDKDAIVFGGTQTDTIKTGIGNSWVDGRGGDDVISTSDRTVLNATSDAYALPDSKAIVAGGPGNDSISVGNGQDTVAGDSSIGAAATTSLSLKQLNNGVESGDPLGSDGHAGVSVTVPDWTTFTNPSSASGGSDGNDTISVGLGQDNVYGNGGDDVLGVASDNPLEKTKCAPAPASCIFRSPGSTIVGGTGNDNIAGGAGNDTIYTGPQVTTAIDGNGGSDDGSTNVVDTGAGNDTVHGSTGEDRVTGHSTKDQVDDIRGGAGNDILVGGYGQDKVYGGPGDDYVIAEPSTVDLGTGPPADDGFGPAYQVTHIDLPAGVTPSSKTLVGGTGRDHIFGGDGGANIDGDGFNATRCGPGAVPSDPVDESANTPSDGNDKIIGGAGVDNVRAGGGDDYVDVKGNNDLACGESGKDTIHGGTGDDQIWGGSDADTIYGESGNDKLYGNDGNDSIYGSDGTDTIEGNNGDDQLFGGADADVVVGGTRASGRPDGSDVIYGDSGDDILIGDNGIEGGSPSGATVYDLGSGNPSLGNNDTIYGGDGADKAYGGLGDDTIYGGNNDDYIEGNSGVDHLYGENGQDDIIGGSSQVASGSGLGTIGFPDAGDVISGGANEDVILGDNGAISRPLTGTSDFTQGRGLMIERLVVPYDWANTDSTKFGGDTINGDGGNDAILGEGGNDTIHGNGGDDYIEGNQGSDSIYGDAGQDDILGGSSQAASGDKTTLFATGEPDTGDAILSGGDDSDVILGDNGFILRTATTGATTDTGTLEDVTKGHPGMTQRRINLYDVQDNASPTLSGGDVINGDNADDVAFGQGGNDTIHGNAGDDYLEGNQGADTVAGDAGQDDIIGGSSLVLSGGDRNSLTATGVADTGDTLLQGGDDSDVILGDNGYVLRIGTTDATTYTNTLEDVTKGHSGMTQRRINLYDVQDNADATRSGGDVITGDNGDDVAFGQGGTDRMAGGAGDDHLEGGQNKDFIEGDAGDDDLIGGSSLVLSGTNDAAQGLQDDGDAMFGGDGNDLLTGDNAVQLRFNPGDSNFTSKFTNRLTPDGKGIVTARWLRRLDLRVGGSLLNAPTGRFGGDQMSGGKGVDTMFGQDGNDFLSGGPDDDYIEGNGGDDTIRGDLSLTAVAATTSFPPGPSFPETQAAPDPGVSWPGSPGSPTDLEGPAGDPGQDDLIGGSSIQGFRDGNDTIEGDDKADFELGDNGALVRTYGAPDNFGVRHYTVDSKRYPTNAVPADAVIVRMGDSTLNMSSTRFCTTAQATCEPAGAYGNDTMFGDAHDDTMWGQDGNDRMRGGSGNDDMYGELGDDTMYGDDGQDAMIGDRGGIVDTYVNGTGDPSNLASYSDSTNSPPAISYTAFLPGTLDRRVDLLHDVNGGAFVGSGTDPSMPHDGVLEGGNDHMRGGGGHDNMHGGAGDDVMNGDSGGDALFGDDGADVIWGGKGCDPISTDSSDSTGLASGESCTDPSSARGVNDKFVDYMFGGKGGSSNASLKGDAGADIMDWQPRGSTTTPGTTCSTSPWPATLSSSVTIDPCDWFYMTSTDDGSPQAAHQTHHGIDWMYGGWDRDIMQADQADEGPNTGDRLIDWTGAYNLYSHCNASYGGFNDVRTRSPDVQAFLQQWSYGAGAGQQPGDVTTSGTSAFDELALVYPSDNNAHGSGAAFPTTPGHFDSPNACKY